MIGQTLKEVTRSRLLELSETILDRKLKPVEYNMFLYKYSDQLDNIHVRIRQAIDKPIVEYLESLKKNENTNI